MDAVTFYAACLDVLTDILFCLKVLCYAGGCVSACCVFLVVLRCLEKKDIIWGLILKKIFLFFLFFSVCLFSYSTVTPVTKQLKKHHSSGQHKYIKHMRHVRHYKPLSNNSRQFSILKTIQNQVNFY